MNQNSDFKIGVSSCLLCNEVRFDGGRKHDGYVTGTLADYFDFVPIYPEIESVFVYKRWRDLVADFTPGKLVEFHTSHKFLLLAHNEKNYRDLGRLISRAGTLEPVVLKEQYQELLMDTMRLKPTVKKHVNVLMHMMGYFKKDLSSDEKSELLEIIERFKNNLVPLIVPITLFNHYVRIYDKPYLKKQLYLTPHPLELKLRNHG